MAVEKSREEIAERAAVTQEEARRERRGEAPIKAEYLVRRNEQAESGSEPKPETKPEEAKPETSSEAKPEPGKKQKKQKRNRRPVERDNLCRKIALGEECPFGDTCKSSHDIQAFIASKPKDLEGTCVLFDKFGKCSFGVRCRFSSSHTTADHKQIVKEQAQPAEELNRMDRDVQIRLRKRLEQFPRTKEYEQLWNQADGPPAQETDDSMKTACKRARTRKHIEFAGKTYLAPLTTVGNLPFRRICKGFGVDITCSEMALASNIVQGQGTELALLRRHASEDLFGVQLAGSRADVMGKAAEFVSNNCQVDFIDVNVGCPIDMAFNSGGGSALLAHPRKLERIVRTVVAAADCDVTVKLRTGVTKDALVAHKLVPKLREWGARLGTLHGRTRQQRYTKLADWDYISQCHEVAPVPLFGDGDVMSWEEYWEHLEARKQSDGVMIGRGALIKPWVFREISERKVWDISAGERLDMLKQFARFGMEHWGTDAQGIETTRRYMLEWQSFLHRYIPPGLLEVLPQRMNERPPPFVGRSDLETLLASPSASDWIKISEMLLGPAHPDFTFVPKHKSNSYS
ncbi:tRNA-dihydrouridine(47) synthase [NAD(P)(+)]-like protein [Coemansia sp. RSA 1290]|nr:tRNA-dihydrouridine synthase 3-like protein [Coemansia mojavensis]KAI9467644.1 tRNA-dihydrouridine synthase 3-like protein [Coemansia mojavensis]KAI9472985.1 tRNA-dihydrouridine synthase 3-like protein [Coemansia mojavensis]KAJ2630048.1 tRNA-dihydrouridine(47) synthase [NAD(P)(+)]-like protein [Coemansia sp. RSA 1290]KAJ2646442.1 tRNA-dihydrouridine(47) synthase [NAD(P)(+)]-like protein [Coemansia sp. RSA 1250]